MVSANANFGPNLGSTIDERRLAMFSSSAQPGGGLQNVSLSASLGGGLQSSYRRINPQTFGQSPLDYSGMSGMQGLGGMHSAPAEMQAERWAELNHLQVWQPCFCILPISFLLLFSCMFLPWANPHKNLCAHRFSLLC